MDDLHINTLREICDWFVYGDKQKAGHMEWISSQSRRVSQDTLKGLFGVIREFGANNTGININSLIRRNYRKEKRLHDKKNKENKENENDLTQKYNFANQQLLTCKIELKDDLRIWAQLNGAEEAFLKMFQVTELQWLLKAFGDNINAEIK
ncbi:hypothetical protein C1645_824183 [Glomus cerebriforme]|uniref:Uncharacterized protein n=1 Tax=Glomus cerebriforme TaxID=658196 RepID=A0A397SV59_9GLOM|nr:hypothetical protein C1645_824183 [Glomus cerebriforme]